MRANHSASSDFVFPPTPDFAVGISSASGVRSSAFGQFEARHFLNTSILLPSALSQPRQLPQVSRMNPQDPTSWNHCFATVNSIRYHYVDEGSGDPIFLVHGLPDLWWGWRHVIPTLVAKGYRCGQTDGPRAKDEATLRQYGFKNISIDLAELLDHICGAGSQAIFIGHDWGGKIVWHMVLHQPHRVKAVGAICTPFSPPNPEYIPPANLVQILPQFKYQEFKYYADEHKHRTFHGALNYYRTRKINLKPRGTLPASSVIPKQDWSLPPGTAQKMARRVRNAVFKALPISCLSKHVPTPPAPSPLYYHSAIAMEKPDELNALISNWLDWLRLRAMHSISTSGGESSAKL
ncbi:Alpha/Beta hydrolase protein [Blyttiomyces helicus]|uniref:Alpha/Beta hydrolase protein n=1 Tax=Blyttiomyces helicus TaxID=388810 RepID=A0A4P9WKE2_9FUNG|nr:Alpha/Beta hydrolase protein [Blyttiomyces helicus]|eukprot:RKO92038.1 Alpha/Beta hydrolase protein [Blyttiomyces helicus]